MLQDDLLAAVVRGDLSVRATEELVRRSRPAPVEPAARTVAVGSRPGARGDAPAHGPRDQGHADQWQQGGSHHHRVLRAGRSGSAGRAPRRGPGMTEATRPLETADEPVGAAVKATARGRRRASGSSGYTAESIQVLEGLEAVRRRPGMYIGSTDVRGLHHLVWEVVDNSIDEAMAGYADRDRAHHHADGSGAQSRQRPRRPGGRHKTGTDALEVVHTVLHAGGKFGGGGYKVSGGLHGVGVSVVNALSESPAGRVRRDGRGLPPGVRARQADHPGARATALGGGRTARRRCSCPTRGLRDDWTGASRPSPSACASRRT